MSVLITVLTFLVIIIVLVLAHEIGHFVSAKSTGITVEEFGLFYPPRLFSIGAASDTKPLFATRRFLYSPGQCRLDNSPYSVAIRLEQPLRPGKIFGGCIRSLRSSSSPSFPFT